MSVIIFIIGGSFATVVRLLDPQPLLALRGIAPDLSKEIGELAKERERLAHLIHREEESEVEHDTS